MFGELRYQSTLIQIPVIDVVSEVFEFRLLSSNGASSSREISQRMRKSLVGNGFVILHGNELTDIVDRSRDDVIAELKAMRELQGQGDNLTATKRMAKFSEIRRESSGTWTAFPRDVTECTSLMMLARNAAFFRLAGVLLEEAPIPDPKIYVRAVSGGFGTQVHVDFPRKAAINFRSLTFWLALFDIEPSMGALFFPQLPSEVEPDKENPWWCGSANRTLRMSAIADTGSHVDINGKYIGLRTMRFRAGDLAVFPSTTLHGTFDHSEPSHRLRLSMDCRWAAPN
jgi:hypothetical protein